MPKKQIYNGFYFYMKELEPTLRRQGRITNGMADVVPIAHPLWKNLTQEERDQYDKSAKEYKARMRGIVGDQYRLDNVGNIIAHRKDPKVETEKRIKKGRQEVVASWSSKDIKDETFYFINFQSLCRTEEGEYIPCEIALIKYSLNKGISKKLHRFIEPGRIPTGYRWSCISNSDDTHKIPVENFDQADENYLGLWIQLENFMNPNGELPEFPPVYCLTNSYEMTSYCLEWICSRTCMGSVNRLTKVYDLTALVVDLYAHSGTDSISVTSVTDMLTSSNWDYVPGTRCDWHEELECNHCSLGIVQKYAYAISDALSGIYDFKLTANHLPCTTGKPPGYVTLPPSLVNVNTRQASSGGPRGRGWAPMERGAGPGSISHSAPKRAGPAVVDDDDEDDNDDDLEDYKTSVRRPNMPAWTPAKQVTPSLAPSNAEQWPSLGGASSKFAGRATAPSASSAPAPPLAWQSSNPLGDGGNFGRGKGLSSLASDVLGVPSSTVRPQTQVTGLGRGMVAPRPTLVPTVGRMSTPAPMNILGQSRGIRLPGSGVIRPPVGRGYAPPGMVQRIQNMSLNKD